MTGRPLWAGSVYEYFMCVCAVKITSTAGSVSSTIFLNTGLAAFCSSMVGLAVASSSLEAAPSWYSATITSASPFDSSPSVS